jgi:hypothetical protein
LTTKVIKKVVVNATLVVSIIKNIVVNVKNTLLNIKNIVLNVKNIVLNIKNTLLIIKNIVLNATEVAEIVENVAVHAASATRHTRTNTVHAGPTPAGPASQGRRRSADADLRLGERDHVADVVRADEVHDRGGREPKAMPACIGGRAVHRALDLQRASRRKLNFSLACSGVRPRSWKTLLLHGRLVVDADRAAGDLLSR